MQRMLRYIYKPPVVESSSTAEPHYYAMSDTIGPQILSALDTAQAILIQYITKQLNSA